MHTYFYINGLFLIDVWISLFSFVYVWYREHNDGASSVAELLHSSKVPGLILCLGHCLCWVSFYACSFYICVGLLQVLFLSSFLPSTKHVSRWIGYALSVPGIGSESTWPG